MSAVSDRGGPSRDADAVLLETARAMMAVSVRAAAALPSGISPMQLRALTVLSALDRANLTDLGTALGMSPSSTSRLCDRLVARGLVDRQVSPRVRREVALSVSEQGYLLLGEYDRLRLDALSAALGTLAPPRRRDVLAALRDLTTAIGAAPAAGSEAGV